MDIVKGFDISNGNTKNKLCKLTNGLLMSRVNIEFSEFTDTHKIGASR